MLVFIGCIALYLTMCAIGAGVTALMCKKLKTDKL